MGRDQLKVQRIIRNMRLDFWTSSTQIPTIPKFTWRPSQKFSPMITAVPPPWIQASAGQIALIVTADELTGEIATVVDVTDGRGPSTKMWNLDKCCWYFWIPAYLPWLVRCVWPDDRVLSCCEQTYFLNTPKHQCQLAGFCTIQPEKYSLLLVDLILCCRLENDAYRVDFRHSLSNSDCISKRTSWNICRWLTDHSEFHFCCHNFSSHSIG